MGTTTVSVRLVNVADPDRQVEVEMIVDSGMVALEELGLTLDPLKRRLRPLTLMIA